MDLPETLVEDLLTWRSLVDIARHQKDHPTSIPDGSGLGVKET